MVIRRTGEDWAVENAHLLRGYRGCQTNLESRVRQYESNGIGIFESEQLTQILTATDLGWKPVQESIGSDSTDTFHAVITLFNRV
jgi:hypothetical protein